MLAFQKHRVLMASKNWRQSICEVRSVPQNDPTLPDLKRIARIFLRHYITEVQILKQLKMQKNI